MPNPAAAAVAFFALGGTVVGAGLLLLFNPRSRGVQWFSVFNSAIIVWLLSQAMLALYGRNPTWELVGMVAVTLLPAFFFAFALVEEADRPHRDGLIVVGFAVLMLPVLLPQLRPVDMLPSGTVLMLIWQAAGWVGGCLLTGPIRRRSLTPRSTPRDRRSEALLATLLSVVPVAIVVGMVVDSDAFFVYLLPLMVVGVQFLVFVGVIRFRFYDIEIRAARTGELAVEAAEAERLAVLGEAAASIAHEVRNPLTGVRSLAQRLAEEEVEPERGRRYAAVILDEVRRVERIVTNLLDVSRRTPRPAERRVDAPLGPLFEDVILLNESRARRMQVTVTASAGGVMAGGVSREPLSQALLNLLLNALAYSPAGGRVELVAQDVEGGVEILVRDQGPGVPVEERDRIFEAFYAGSAAGTGLGLSVVRRLSREHGWEVSVGDAPGGGAEFRLRLPASYAGAGPGAGESAVVRPSGIIAAESRASAAIDSAPPSDDDVVAATNADPDDAAPPAAHDPIRTGAGARDRSP